jgi:hypothetical protein
MNGLLSVPNAGVDALSKAVDQVRSRERRLMEFVRGDQFSLDGVMNLVVE